MIKAITPKEAEEKNICSFPDEVIESFNELIAANLRGKSSTIGQEEVLKLIRSKNSSLTSGKVIEKGWLDVEKFYRNAGWKVKYDKPGWDEDYDPFFVFSKN
jgi:hypothetical protein